MKVIIVYKSIHQGNTRKIATVMAKTINADLMQPHEVDTCDLSEYDLIGFGSGIYGWRHHIDILQLAGRLPAMNMDAFIFSTRGMGSVSLCHKALKDKLLRKNFSIIGEFSCKCHNTVGPLKVIGGINKGRPNEHDMERVEEFIKNLVI